MYLTTVELTGLIRRLEAARQSFSCSAKRDGEQQFVPKPRTRRQPGHVYPNGDKLVVHEDQLGIWIEPGIHGRAFAGIDPATGEVCCTECARKKGGA